MLILARRGCLPGVDRGTGDRAWLPGLRGCYCEGLVLTPTVEGIWELLGPPSSSTGLLSTTSGKETSQGEASRHESGDCQNLLQPGHEQSRHSDTQITLSKRFQMVKRELLCEVQGGSGGLVMDRRSVTTNRDVRYGQSGSVRAAEESQKGFRL